MFRILVILQLLFVPCIALSDEDIIEKYYPILIPADDTTMFALAGDIDMRTSLNFKRAVQEYGVPDVFLLNSGGGLVYIGLDLAMEVNRLGVTTVIPEDLSCYSACSFVFLAGKERILDGELGIHQISSEDADLTRGQFTLADMIDVLNSFDVPAELYPPMLSTPPEEMYIVSAREIQDMGLDSRALAKRHTVKNTPKVQKTNLEELAMNFVYQLQFAQSSGSPISVRELVSKYDQYVDYYGSTYTIDEIYDDKSKFFARWPERTYVIDENKSSIRCNQDGTCFFSGVTIWQAEAPQRKAKASGEAQLEYELRYENGVFKIIKENSLVIRRNN